MHRSESMDQEDADLSSLLKYCPPEEEQKYIEDAEFRPTPQRGASVSSRRDFTLVIVPPGRVTSCGSGAWGPCSNTMKHEERFRLPAPRGHRRSQSLREAREGVMRKRR